MAGTSRCHNLEESCQNFIENRLKSIDFNNLGLLPEIQLEDYLTLVMQEIRIYGM